MSRLLKWLTISAVVAGCAVGTEDSAHRLELELEAGVLPTATSDDGEADPGAMAVSVYLVRDNRLVHVTREAPPSASAAAAAVSAAIAGPTPAEARLGIWSAIPPGTSVLGVRVQDRVAEIDLSSEFAAIGGTDEVLAVAQIVWSATALAEVDGVTLSLDGSPTSAPRADGVLESGPLTADDYQVLLGQ